ncbi:helix-turn-helix transcriptional regulator [Clostridium sp. KNHs205]|jgi:putative transcriptional regulator|uniref:helix-turn-helix domain-containing protein n=1 Tax=Clostridium sp. KNHs205 TaxID=1449050 RepID=UPI0009DD4A71|nr:helix-turn-helix transcriptional regulator [Clostridium sp. KNHs205]
MSEKQIKISYKPLWRLLLERDMTKVDLRKKTQIAPSTFTKMSNNEQVSLDILARICLELKCGFDDIVEISSENGTGKTV